MYRRPGDRNASARGKKIQARYNRMDEDYADGLISMGWTLAEMDDLHSRCRGRRPKNYRKMRHHGHHRAIQDSYNYDLKHFRKRRQEKLADLRQADQVIDLHTPPDPDPDLVRARQEYMAWKGRRKELDDLRRAEIDWSWDVYNDWFWAEYEHRYDYDRYCA